MAIELRQSTAGQEIPLGHFLDSSDGDTAETGLTIVNTDIKLWKWGATTLANKNSGGATHIAGGVYYTVLDATDTDTLGPLIVFVHESGSLVIKVECAVLTANMWDSKYSTDKLEVDVNQVGGTAVPETSGKLHVLDDGGDAIAPAATALSDATWTDARAGKLDNLDTTVSSRSDFDETADPVELLTTGGTAGKNAAEVVDDVWDEVLTVETHNVGYSAGQRLRYLILDGGLAQAGGTSSITLAATASAEDNIYVQNIVSVVGGTGAGQTRSIMEYDGATKVAIVDRPWQVEPAADSVYELLPSVDALLATHGTATAGSADTITLGASALGVAESYVGCVIYIAAGTGVGQSRLISAYTIGRVATVSPAWDTQPDNTSVYRVLSVGRVIVDSMAADAITGIWHHLLTGITTAGSVGKLLKDNVDAAVSSRSSHDDPDPSGHIDAAISSRSSHGDPDPSGYIDAAVSSRSSHAAADVISALMADTSWALDGKTVAQALADVLAGLGGRVTVSGDAYTYYADDETTPLFTLTLSATGAERS